MVFYDIHINTIILSCKLIKQYWYIDLPHRYKKLIQRKIIVFMRKAIAFMTILIIYIQYQKMRKNKKKRKNQRKEI